MSRLDMRRVGHAFFGRKVIEGVSLSIATQEIVALVGPSGSGKSTLAHIAAGLVTPQEGQVTRSYHRHAMVFQEPRMLPWATAADNIGFALRLTRAPRRQQAGMIRAAALRAGLLPEDLDKYPAELSGGMRQRSAIARALVTEPDFIYFDEPFTALDVALKRRMQDLVIEAAAAARFAALFITHDLFEAIRICHRILVLDVNGRGIGGQRILPGAPGSRDDAAIFELRQHYLTQDPLFAHIHDIDERLRL